MLYREAGQFKTTYKADSQVMPVNYLLVLLHLWQ